MAAVFSLSLRASVFRFYFDDKSIHGVNKMYSSIVYFLFIFASFCYLMLFFGGKYLSTLLEIKLFPYLTIALLASYISIFYHILLSLLLAQEKAKQISVIRLALSILTLILNIVFVLTFEDKLLGFLVSWLIISSIDLILFFIYSKRYLGWGIDLIEIKKYLKYALVQLPSDLSGWIITFSDRLIINKIKGASDTGVFGIGQKMAMPIQMIGTSVKDAYVPFTFSLYKDLDIKNEKELNRTALHFFTLFSFVSIIIVVFSKELFQLVDVRYRDGASVLMIMALAYLFRGYRFIFSNPTAYNVKFVKYRSLINISAAIINVGLNVLLIPKYSIKGAALATLITYLIRFVLMFFLAQKAIRINYSLREFLSVIVLSVLFSFCVLLNVSILSFSIKLLFGALYLLLLIKISNINVKHVTGRLIGKIKINRRS